MVRAALKFARLLESRMPLALLTNGEFARSRGVGQSDSRFSESQLSVDEEMGTAVIATDR